MEQKTRARQIVVSAISNASIMAAKVLITFFVTPILVRGFGDTQFGIWIFVSSITSYFALGNFGVNNSVTRFVAKYHGLNDRERIQSVFMTSTAFLLGVAALLMAVTLISSYVLNSPFNAPPELAGQARWLYICLGIAVAVGMPLGLPSALLAGLGLFPIRNYISLFSLIFRNAMFVGVAWYGGGLVGIGIVLLVNVVLDFAISYAAARHYVPTLSFSFRHVDKGTVKIIGGYSASIFTGSLANLVVSQSAIIIIGVLLTPVATTHFSIGSTLISNTMNILGVIAFVLTPAASEWEARDEHSAVSDLFIVSSRYAFYLTLPVELGLIVLGYPFLSLWMGAAYAESSYLILLILSIPLLLSAANLVSARILEGVGRAKSMAILMVLQAFLTVGIGLALVRPYGIEGVAMGVSLGVLICAPISVVLACRYNGISTWTFLQAAVWKPIVATVPAVATWIVAKQLFPLEDWATFLSVGTIGMIPWFGLLIAMEPAFRNRLKRALAFSY